MAILTENSSGEGPITGWALEPVESGNYMAICLDVKDSFGIQRPKYEDPTQIETVDLTRFLFGLQTGQKVQTGEIKISCHEKSTLMKHLRSWLNMDTGAGFDTETLKGKGAMINIITKVSQKGRTYSDITSISPIPQGMESQIPNLAMFASNESDINLQNTTTQQVAPPSVSTQVTIEQPQNVQQTMGQQFTGPAKQPPPF